MVVVKPLIILFSQCSRANAGPIQHDPGSIAKINFLYDDILCWRTGSNYFEDHSYLKQKFKKEGVRVLLIYDCLLE